MNNYELHEKTQQLADTETPYALAKQVVELTEKLKLAYEDNNKIRGRMHDQWASQNKMKGDAIINTADDVMRELDSTRQDEWHQETINRAIVLRDLK